MWVDAKKTIHEYTNDAPFSLVDNLQVFNYNLHQNNKETITSFPLKKFFKKTDIE